MTRQQVCCLLALCFLNSFPLPQTRTYQHFTLALFLSFAFYASQRGKLLCILHYFDRIYEAEVSGNNEFLSMCISVLRHHVKEEDPTLSWAICESPLTAFDSPMDGGLIEGAHGCLQVDFANAYIGGGVLSMGNVQVNIKLFPMEHPCMGDDPATYGTQLDALYSHQAHPSSCGTKSCILYTCTSPKIFMEKFFHKKILGLVEYLL